MNKLLKMLNPTFKQLSITFLLLISASGFVVAQDEVEPESKPTAQTEIVCYAALKKWVCAPADEKQQAHDKAMKLVEEQPQFETLQRGGVEIKTLEMNNDFSQQVQEPRSAVENKLKMMEKQTEDFMPRADSSKPLASVSESQTSPSINTAASEVDNATSVNNSNSDVLQIATSGQVVESVSHSSMAVENMLSTDFGVWQNNHGEKWSLQVVGTSNQRYLDQFIVDNGLQQTKHSKVKTQVSGADWWIVLVGLYESRNQALMQRDQLPAVLSDQAWVRQIKTIDGVPE